MLDRIKKWLTILDLPSGVILGIHTGTMVGLSIAAFIMKRDIATSIITVFGMNLGAFAVHKTSTAITSITQTTEGTNEKP